MEAAINSNLDQSIEFRDDLRKPKVVFGRCGITGEWGKCITIDLGDISVQTPDTERGVTIDDETGSAEFKFWKPVIIQNQMTVSELGLRKLLEYMESQDNPIPVLTPELVYKWMVIYDDGSALTQFRIKPDTEDEEEVNSREIDFSRVAQISIVPHFDPELPTYTFVKETGKIYRAGEEIDLMYDGLYQPEATVVYARKVTHTWGSQATNDLSRHITNTHTNVVQLLGWKVGGLQGPGPGMIIAIDERGNWRPFDYM
jgi:hypothetical protein